jgi:GH15 family glucan-1,4-alpha-glucosidase
LNAPTRAAAPAPQILRQYALLADGERGAVIGPDGAIVWLCVPRWDSGAVFSTLIGGTSHYTVAPAGRFVWGGHYEPGTLIWRSRWVGEGSVVECREALLAPGRADTAVLLRRLEVHEGHVHADVVLHARGAYDADPARHVRRQDDGAWTASTGPLHVRWTGAPHAHDSADGHGGRRLATTVSLAAGEHHDLVLEISTGAPQGPSPDAATLWTATEQHWRDTVPAMDDTAGTRDARHAYAVLSGLTSGSGGTVAAATTSLPERSDAGRNYDYRYVWIRDQCLVGQAVAAAGPHRLLDDAVRFVAARVIEDGDRLAPAYTADGGPVPGERSLDLPGYPGGTDVVGNHVTSQFQLDIFGEALLLFSTAAAHDHLDVDGWRAAELAVDAIGRRWHEPDAGIWELDLRRWAHSALQCTAGLRAIAAARDAPAGPAATWMTLADAILLDVSRGSLHPSGRWQRAPDDTRVDAALLLPALRGALPPGDPRTLATFNTVRDELTEDGYLYRFRHDARPLGDAEGAFLLCGFWMALACLDQNEPTAAARWFERNRAACGPPGLYAEEFDVRQRQLRGNLPQAFVHAGMLECAARLGRAT